MCACAGSTHSVSPARTHSVPISVCVRVLLLSFCTLLVQVSQRVSCVPVSEFFPFGHNVSDSMTDYSDDGGSGRINLTVMFPFFGNPHDKLYVNNNGVISFFKALKTYRPADFPLSDETPIIAPYWADVDITATNGTVWYRETRKPNILKKATNEIRAYSAYGNFRAYWVFVATWEEVGFYGAKDEGLEKNNTFQAVLVLDWTGTKSFVILNYAKIEWTTGSNSQGDTNTGLGGSPAQAGFNAGDQVNFFEIEGARTGAVINLTQTSNTGVAGKWIFRIDSAAIQDVCPQSESSSSIFFQPTYDSMLSSNRVDVKGLCLKSVDSIQGRLDSGEELCCQVEYDQARCYIPPVFQTGLINISLSIDDKGFNHTGTFEIRNIMDIPAKVKRHDPEKWIVGESVKISWKKGSLPERENYTIDILEYKNVNRSPSFSVVSSSTDETEEDEMWEFYIKLPDSFSGLSLALVRVTLPIAHCNSSAVAGPTIYSDVFPVRYATRSKSESVCSKWLSDQAAMPPLTVEGQCPCILRQAASDTAQYTPDPFCNKNSQWPSNCLYRSRAAGECIFPNQRSESSGTFICCYDNTTEELLIALEGTGGGTRQRYTFRQGPTADDQTVVPYFTYMQEEVAPYLHCCEYSNNETQCNQFLQYRQPVDCQGYVPPAAAQAAGDPHIETLDRYRYTFNGVGDFILLRVNNTDAVVQVRTVQAKDVHDQPQNATVFSAIAVKASNTSALLEISLAENSEDLVSVLVNNENFPLTTPTSQLTEMTLYKEIIQNGTLGMTVVMEEVGLSILVEASKDLLNIMVTAGSHLMGKLEGLLGNFDNDKSNDLTASNGTVLALEASMRDIHYAFGMSWHVPDNRSLFTQTGDFDNTSPSPQESTVSYEPIFIDEIANSESQQAAMQICGENVQCRYDYIITGKESIAASTLKFNQKFEERMQDLTKVVRCPYVSASAIENGNRTLSGLKAGDTIVVQCKEGYKRENGSDLLTCTEEGEWDSSPAVCVEELKPDTTFDVTYVAIGTAAGGFVLIVILFLTLRVVYKRYRRKSGKPPETDNSDIEQAIELPGIFQFSPIPSRVFENSLFMSSLNKLSDKGSFRIPRPTFVDPNIYSEYF